MMNLRGLTLITGSNGGIARSISEFLLEKGHRDLIFQYRSSKEEISNLLKKYDLNPDKCLFHSDLTVEKEVINLQHNIEKNFDEPVLNLLNVAGSSTNGMSWKLSLEDFRKVIDNNLTSNFLTSKQFIPKMRGVGYGRIVNFSSVVGFTGAPGASHYSAAKAAIVGLTKSLASELASKQITVNAVALGYFDSGLIDSVSQDLQEKIKQSIPMKRFGTKNDIGSLISYLIDQNTTFTTGQVLHLNGGQF